MGWILDFLQLFIWKTRGLCDCFDVGLRRIETVRSGKRGLKDHDLATAGVALMFGDCLVEKLVRETCLFVVVCAVGSHGLVFLIRGVPCL